MGMEMKRTKKRCGLPEVSCKDSNFWYVFNIIKIGDFFSLLIAFHTHPPHWPCSFFFFTRVNAFKTFFWKSHHFQNTHKSMYSLHNF